MAVAETLALEMHRWGWARPTGRAYAELGERRAGPAGGRMPARLPAAGEAGGFNAVQKLLTNCDLHIALWAARPMT